jgi:hypothetical protein
MSRGNMEQTWKKEIQMLQVQNILNPDMMPQVENLIPHSPHRTQEH